MLKCPVHGLNSLRSEATETLEVNSEADRWRELRFRLEPVIIIARTTTPFLTGRSNRKWRWQEMLKIHMCSVFVIK